MQSLHAVPMKSHYFIHMDVKKALKRCPISYLMDNIKRKPYDEIL